ncbi:MAG: fumarylacetoacetate hydrolase family protein [Leucobacter sp.]
MLPPVQRPGKIICAGLNYYAHAEEVGKTPPDVPTLFTKFASALAAPAEDLVIPALSEEIDWEAELAIVIGKRVKAAGPVAARAAIFGYTVLNDVSARDWQRRTSEWFQGKNFDRSTPIGPVIVTADELDVEGGVGVECAVNGVRRQSGTTADLIFKPADLIMYITQFMTLEPGDIIATGTPAGVGMASKPPTYLQDGDTLTTSIEGIGELVNVIRIDRSSAQ